MTTAVYRSGRKKGLPKLCECGGKMLYEFDFGRVWSCCDTCSPVVLWPSSITNPRPTPEPETGAPEQTEEGR